MDNSERMLAFGKNLRERRTALAMTQAELAQMLGYSAKAISKWEKGKGLPSAVLLPVLASALNTDIDSLMKVAFTPLYYLGIDGGGTKTEFVLTDATGNPVATKRLDGSNPNDVGMSGCFGVLKEGITAVCQGIAYERVSVFAGIAGAGTGDNAQSITKFLSTFGFAAADCGSDAKNAIAASLGKRDGIMVIMGTGNVTFAQKDGQITKFGGYNYFFDEGGSGFTVGRDAITYALKAEERGETDTLFYQMIRQKCGTDSVLDRLRDFYIDGKRAVAQFAPVVFEAYDRGDAVAAAILEQNMAVVAEQISCAVQRLSYSCPEIFLVGGLTNKADILVPMLKKHIVFDCNINAYTGSPVKGALLLAGLEENYA